VFALENGASDNPFLQIYSRGLCSSDNIGIQDSRDVECLESKALDVMEGGSNSANLCFPHLYIDELLTIVQ
jgi:hypothetical protein